jgi:hypothetical protein
MPDWLSTVICLTKLFDVALPQIHLGKCSTRGGGGGRFSEPSSEFTGFMKGGSVCEYVGCFTALTVPRFRSVDW